MMTTDAPSLADRLTISIAEVRASIAAEGARKGLKGALLAAILGFLETLAALLAEFRAGRLVAMAPTPRAASAAPTPPLPRFAGEGEGPTTSPSRCTAPSFSTPGSGPHCAGVMETARRKGELVKFSSAHAGPLLRLLRPAAALRPADPMRQPGSCPARVRGGRLHPRYTSLIPTRDSGHGCAPRGQFQKQDSGQGAQV